MIINKSVIYTQEETKFHIIKVSIKSPITVYMISKFFDTVYRYMYAINPRSLLYISNVDIMSQFNKQGLLDSDMIPLFGADSIRAIPVSVPIDKAITHTLSFHMKAGERPCTDMLVCENDPTLVKKIPSLPLDGFSRSYNINLCGIGIRHIITEAMYIPFLPWPALQECYNDETFVGDINANGVLFVKPLSHTTNTHGSLIFKYQSFLPLAYSLTKMKEYLLHEINLIETIISKPIKMSPMAPMGKLQMITLPLIREQIAFDLGLVFDLKSNGQHVVLEVVDDADKDKIYGHFTKKIKPAYIDLLNEFVKKLS